MSLPKIMVTGANGQLGKELQDLSSSYPQFEFIFLSRADLPIHHFGLIRNFFEAFHPDYCINAAAYTAVDKAETEADLAMLVNGQAVGELATCCQDYHCRLLHISTDYVFDGESAVPYREDDPVSPVNLYGRSKLEGEVLAQQNCPDSVIVRTSWVYSSHGHNFVKTMLRLFQEKKEINVVNDQIGSPTYAADLAKALLQIIQYPDWHPGVFHYSGEGKISWYELALAIRDQVGSPCTIHPITTAQYPTPARRPHFSLLDTQKLQRVYGVHPVPWKKSLEVCLGKLANN